MIEALLFGCSFAFACAVQPGPLQAFLLSRVADRGVRATLPASLAPLLSDGPIAVVMLLFLKTLPPGMGRVLQGAGGVLLLYLAYCALRSWKIRPGISPKAKDSAPRTLRQAVAVNILNPNPYLGWSLVLGPKTLIAWSSRPANAVVLVAGFYITMVVMLAVTIFLFGSARLLGVRGRRILLLLSAVTLAALGVVQLIASVR